MHEVHFDHRKEHKTVELTVDKDIQYRIRSLLEPRNKRRPPEALYSSPDLKHYPRHGDQVLAADQLIPSRSHILDAGQIVLFPARLNFLPSTMVVTRFNRSAFEVADGFKGPLRKVSQPDMRAGRAYAVDGPWSSVESGLSQRAIVDSPDGEMSVSGGVKHADFMSSKSPSKSRPPHYDLRVLPPKRSRVRPDVLHVPGSYKSEITPDGYGSPELGGQHAEDDHRGHNHGNLDLNDHLGTIVEPSTSALAALDELKKYEVRPLEVSKRVVDEQGCGNGGGSVYMEVAPLISRSSSLHAVQSDAQERTDTNSTALLTGVPTPVAQKEVDVSAPLSPVSRALSALSDLSSRSKSRRESSVSITPNQRRGSAIKPSEIRQIGKSPSTVSTSHSVNRENEQQSQWVQQLVGKRPAASPSSSNLTARLQRQNTQSVVGPGGLRTWTMPDPNDNKTASRKVGTEDTDEADFAQRQQNNSQSFSKVIVDLENLLKEALTIAGKTASRDASEAEQNDVMEKPRKQSNKRYNQVRSTETSCNSKTESSISGGADEEDMHITSGMGGRVTIVDPDPDASYHGHFIEYRDATPYPAQSTAITRQQSTVRPIGQCSSDDKEVTTKSRDIGMPLGKPINENAPAETSHHLQPFKSTDWAYSRKASANLLTGPQKPPSIQMPLKEESRLLAHNEGMSGQQRPPIIQPRSSSKKLQGRRAPKQEELNLPDHIASSGGSESDGLPYVADYKTSALQCHPIIQEVMDGDAKRAAGTGPYPFRPRQDTIASLRAKETLTYSSPRRLQNAEQEDYSLKDRHHFSIREPKGFSLSRSHRRKPIARDWSTGRKRLVATVDCITTALMGLILGIYAGEVPALQYALADEHHYTILGNVVFFLGLAITTILLWPLPLLHGRKPYTMAALVILLPLQFPQALAVNSPRSPYVPSYKVGVLLPRAFSGLVMGFANINFMTTLLDLFGASLQSGNPHQESVNENDVRRHGGGIGAWLGIWTWCSIMSIGLGFLIGAGIISGLGVSWGFWITIILNAVVLLLNVMAPEVRRSPYRRSMAEVRSGTDVSRRVARGEVKMHLESTGPKHWYEEVLAGYVLCLRMLRQPGFLVLALYQGWIYGQIVMVIVVSHIIQYCAVTD